MILALFVAAAVMFGYSAFFGPKSRDKDKQEEVAGEGPATAETAGTAEKAPPETAGTAVAETGSAETSASGETAAPETAVSEKPPETAEGMPKPLTATPPPVKTGARAVVTTPLYTATFEDGGLVGLSLAKYPPDEDQLLFTRLGNGGPSPFTPLVEAGEGARWDVDKTKLSVGSGESGKIVFTLREGEAVRARAEYIFHGGDYEIDANVVAGAEDKPVTLGMGYFVREEDDPKETGDISVDALVGTKKKRDKLGSKDEVKNYQGDIPWAAMRSKYFIVAALSPNGSELNVVRHKNKDLSATYHLSRGGPYTIYVGPKNYDRLKEFDVGLERTVDLGWSFIGIIAALMLRLMHIINGVVHNYGVTVIIFSVIIKLLTYWPTAVSLKSSQRMQEIQPILKQLREQYKSDPQRMNAETMALYKKYKINPFGSCLPMLLQIPVFWGMFNALRNAIELKGAPFMLWITDLSQPDVLWQFPGDFKIPLVNIASLNVLPILMTAIWYVQNLLTMPGKGGVKSEQQKIMAFMPLIFGLLFYNWPSGLVLYWTINQLLTMGQTLIMKRTMKPLEAD
jgi:YidC/Oxa1 family membrane protein insertase